MRAGYKEKMMAFNLRILTMLPLVAITVSNFAKAETLFLNCKDENGTVTVLAIDLTNRTVGNRPVNISATAFDWEVSSADGVAVSRNHIDRVSGTFTSTMTVKRRDGNGVNQNTFAQSCAAGAAPVTKF
jgi:hypothetical protein